MKQRRSALTSVEVAACTLGLLLGLIFAAPARAASAADAERICAASLDFIGRAESELAALKSELATSLLGKQIPASGGSGTNVITVDKAEIDEWFDQAMFDLPNRRRLVRVGLDRLRSNPSGAGALAGECFDARSKALNFLWRLRLESVRHEIGALRVAAARVYDEAQRTLREMNAWPSARAQEKFARTEALKASSLARFGEIAGKYQAFYNRLKSVRERLVREARGWQREAQAAGAGDWQLNFDRQIYGLFDAAGIGSAVEQLRWDFFRPVAGETVKPGAFPDVQDAGDPSRLTLAKVLQPPVDRLPQAASAQVPPRGKTEYVPDQAPSNKIVAITVLRGEADFPFVRKRAPDSRRWLLFALLNEREPSSDVDYKILSSDLAIQYRQHGPASDLRGLRERPKNYSPFLREGFNRVLEDNRIEDALWLGGMKGVLIIAETVDSTFGLLPSYRKLTINGAEGEWLLDPGTISGDIRFVRPVTTYTTDYEQLDEAYIYDKVQIEIRIDKFAADDKLRAVNQLDVTVFRNGDVLEFDDKKILTARRVEDEPELFRTAPIYLAPADQAAAKRGEVYYQPFSVGDRLIAAPADRWFASPIVNEIVVYQSPALLVTRDRPNWKNRPKLSWKDALIMAGNIWGRSSADLEKLSEEEADTFYNLFIFQASGHTTKFSVKDHAAMLLLRDQFVWMATQQKQLLESISRDNASLRAYARQLMHVIASTPLEYRSNTFSRGLLGLKVLGFTDPDALAWLAEQQKPPARRNNLDYRESRRIPLAEALEEYWNRGGQVEFEDTYVGNSKPDWLLGIMQYAVEQQLGWIDGAIRHAIAIKIKDIEALVELTGDQFGVVLQRLYPRLVVQVEKTGADGRNEKVWIPDDKARVAAGQVNAGLFELSKARQAGREDTDALLTIVSAVAGGASKVALFKVIALAANAADALLTVSDIVKLENQREEIRFARNAASVIGWDRFNFAVARSKPDWYPFANLLVSIIGIKYDVADLYRAIKLEATEYAKIRKFLDEIKSQGALAVKQAAPEDVRTFVLAVEDARLAQATKKQLTPVQREILEAAKQLEDDAASATRTFVVRKQARAVAKIEGPSPGAPKPNQILYQANGEPVRLANGDVLELGDFIAKGEYADVYKLQKAGKQTGKVVKIIRKPHWEKSSIEDIMKRWEKSDAVYKEFVKQHPGTPILESYEFKQVEKMGVVVQDDLEAIAAYRFDGDWSSLPPEAFELVLKLYRQFSDAKIGWLDPHLKNMFFTKGRDGKLVAAGVLDTDLLLPQGSLADGPFMAARIVDREQGLNQRILSADNKLTTGGSKVDKDVDDRIKAVMDALRDGTWPAHLDAADVTMTLEKYRLETAELALNELDPDLLAKVRLNSAELVMVRALEAYGFIKFERASLSELARTQGAVRGKFVDGTMSVNTVKNYFDLEKYVTFGDYLLKAGRHSRLRLAAPPVETAAECFGFARKDVFI